METSSKITSFRDDFSETVSTVSKLKKLKKGVFKNPEPIENPNFDYKDLSTLENHWLKFKGKMYKGRKKGICTIYLFNGEKLRCSFKKG